MDGGAAAGDSAFRSVTPKTLTIETRLVEHDSRVFQTERDVRYH